MLPNGYTLDDQRSSTHEVFRLAHLSDPHLFSSSGVRIRELLNKRVYGYLAWHLHRHAEHRHEVFAALREDMQAAKPDQVVLTGDLTHLGLPNEFLEARELLRSLGPPSKVMVVPGNHDAYVATAGEQAIRLLSDYIASDGELHSPRVGREDPRSAFPTLRVRAAVALIGVCTAYPTPPFLATGRIGEVQMDKIENILAETRRRGLLRVVLMHHPPVSGAVSWRKRLTDQGAFQALLARHGAELILHGHTHRTFVGHLETPWGSVFSIGAPSASALGRTARRRARYHLFRLVRRVCGLEMFLSVRVYSLTERRFVEEGEQEVPLPSPFG